MATYKQIQQYIKEEKIHKIEHKIYPLAVKYFCNGRLAINGRKVEILKGE